MKDGISIVMSYHSRRIQLSRTLSSITKSKYDKSKLEVIIINDVSDDIQDIVNSFSELNIVLYNIKEKQKNWINACIPYNIGFNLAIYDKIIIQNPESFHNGDILSYVDNNLTNQNYLSFGCYSLSYTEFTNNDYNNINISDLPFKYICDSGWYNHSKHRPVYYHFCSAISYDNLCRLNGFDEEYGYGIGFDDNEILHRIRLLGLNMEIIDNPIVYHQWHSSVYHYNDDTDINIKINTNRLFGINKELYSNTLSKKTHIINNNLFFNKR
jgi:hypothetical protein